MAKTYNVGRLSVEMVADTVQYVQKLKAAESTTKKSQKRIRNDMEQTGNKAKKSAKDVSKLNSKLQKLGEVATFINGPMGGVASRITSLNSIVGGAGGAIALTGGLALGIAAATTAAVFAATAYAQQYKELKIYAEIAGITTREMQLMESATKTVGVSAEKFGDIIKDVQDKIGDFVATGGGEFRNVMEVLGDKIPYTAKELQNMAGPDALEAVAHSMQAANLPMSQQIFLMESIANDASKLLPLYANLSAELEYQKYQASLLTRTMDEELLQTYLDLSKQTVRLKDNFTDFIADSLEPLAGWFVDVAENANFFFASLEEGTEAHRLSRMADLSDDIKQLEKDLADTESAWGRFGNVLTLTSTDADVLRKEIKKLKDEYKGLLDEGTAKFVPDGTDDGKKTEVDPQSWYGSENFKKTVAEAKAAQAAQEANDKRIAKMQQERRDKELKEQEAAHKKAIEADVTAFNEMDKLRKEHIQNQKDLHELEKMALSGPSGSPEDALNQQLALLELEHDREMELLRQQYADKEGLEDQYIAAMKAKKNQYHEDIFMAHKASVDAELALYKSVASGIAEQASALAGASDEEKAQLTKQFLLKQALAAADASLAYYATLSAHEAAAASMGPAGAAYLATQTGIASANLAKNLAGIGAVTIGGLAAGQFHSGTDNVPSEGSYLLQQGERVIQPKANQDLTSFLKDKNSGGGMRIDAPLTIQGNVTDEKWFDAQLAKHRNTIAAAIAKVNRERPATRRRTNR